MKDIFLITKERITWENCKAVLVNAFPSVEGNDSFALIGKSPKTIQMWFDNSDTGDRLLDTPRSESDFSGETISHIPIKNGYVMNVEYHLKKEMVKLISQLINLYPEMYLIDDDERVISGFDYIGDTYSA